MSVREFADPPAFSAASRGLLNWFTPLPPARNGIADYAAMLLAEVARLTPCACYCEDPLAEAPASVEIRDAMQAFRHLEPGARILHQVGNNRGHVFALDALRRFGGVTSLHDLSLLYVNELSSARASDLFGRMRASAPALGEAYARHWRDFNLKTSANYILFDMVGEILDRSSHVIVHSEFARRKLAAVHGARAAGKISVVPHFAKKIRLTSSRQARQELGLDPDVPLILTSGFATRAKRFDWLIAALDALRGRGLAFRWIHAGEERPAEYALSREIQARPGLGDLCEVTGYLSEEKLDCYIGAADIVVNLRFPSVGESSGTLARAFSAGRCCIVSDTAAYSEIPRDAVIHTPLFDSSGALTRTLEALLKDRSLQEMFGRRARQYARTALSIESVARSYVAIVDDATRDAAAHGAARRSPLRNSERPDAGATIVECDAEGDVESIAAALKSATGAFEATFWFASDRRFSAAAADRLGVMRHLSAPHIELKHVRFIAGPDDDRIGLRVHGYAA